MKKLSVVVFFILLTSFAFGEDDLIITPYFSQKAHIYTDKSRNTYSESYSVWGIEASYFLNSFLIGFVKTEAGSLISTHSNVDMQLNSNYSALIPSGKASRSLYNLGIGSSLYFFTNPENIFYFGLEYNYLMFKPMNYNKLIYEESKSNVSAIAFSMGDRFLLFPSWILNLEVNFAFPFKRMMLPLHNANTQYTFFNYIISLRLGIGILF